jgi:putative ABC transport system substrate-binding protein
MPEPPNYTIGIASEFLAEEILDGFKNTMTELGYVEEENITYIYHGILGGGQQANEAEIESLMAEHVDLLLTFGNAPTQVAQKAVEGTDIPVVFAPATNPLGEKFVASLRHPAGALTGIQSTDPTPKALEWLLRLAPDTTLVYAPYHSADRIAQMSIKLLPDTATQLGVELVLDEVSSGDQVLAAVKKLPPGSAILFPISPSIDPSLDDILDLAVELGIPAGSTTNLIQDKLLFTYAIDLPYIGEQAGVLVDKILKGAKPGELPVETAEFILLIDLRTAQAIGLDIPDEILRQAQRIVR